MGDNNTKYNPFEALEAAICQIRATFPHCGFRSNAIALFPITRNSRVVAFFDHVKANEGILMSKLTRFYFSCSQAMPNAFSINALLGAFFSLLLVGWAVAILTKLLGLPFWAALIVVILPLLALGYVAILAAALLCEKIWKVIGIYRLLNVTNNPIEQYFLSFCGVETNG